MFQGNFYSSYSYILALKGFLTTLSSTVFLSFYVYIVERLGLSLSLLLVVVIQPGVEDSVTNHSLILLDGVVILFEVFQGFQRGPVSEEVGGSQADPRHHKGNAQISLVVGVSQSPEGGLGEASDGGHPSFLKNKHRSN